MQVWCSMKKGICEAVVTGSQSESDVNLPQSQIKSPQPHDLKGLILEIDTKACLRCPYFIGPSNRPPIDPITPGETIRPPVPSHPDIHDPRPPEKKPLRF